MGKSTVKLDLSGLEKIKKKLKKHIKIMFSPLKYFLEPFAIIKYLFKLLMTKG